MVNKNNQQKNKAFWYKIDSLPIEDLHLWGELLVLTKHLSNKNPKQWLDLIDLVNLTKSNTNYQLTQKQKRYMTMLILSSWDELENEL